MLVQLKVEKHPDKTFIGRVTRGLYFLGYRFSPDGLGVAPVTVERFAERVSRLYEQGATASRIWEYARRWMRWVRSGVCQKALAFVGPGTEAVAAVKGVLQGNKWRTVNFDDMTVRLGCLYSVLSPCSLIGPLVFPLDCL